jgi:hypothetical protein
MTRDPAIRLHGVGSNGVNLVTLADVWRHALPDTEFAAPDAPFSFGHGSSRQTNGVTETNRPERAAARKAFFTLWCFYKIAIDYCGDISRNLAAEYRYVSEHAS